MRVVTRTFLLALVALALMASGAQAGGGQTITDPVVIANDDAAPAGDFYAVRGRIDSGTDLVVAGVSSGTTVSIFQANSTGGAFPGYEEIDSETFDASECKAVTAGLSLYCKDTASGSFLRLRGTRAQPGSWRVNASVRGRDFEEGKPFGTPLAAEVDLGSAGGAFLGVTAICRLSHNGDRYTCNGEGVAPTPAPATPTPTPTPAPTPTPTPAGCGASGTYTDNCDGTVTDSSTGRVWEKKTDDGGVHDKDNLYSWSTGDNTFNGTAATVFLATLNTVPCFAGFCDWRLPTIEELSGRSDGGYATGGIVDLTVPGCGAPSYSAPCINAIFGPTKNSYYWSSSTYPSDPSAAWGVYFTYGGVSDDPKTSPDFVRAVRTVP